MLELGFGCGQVGLGVADVARPGIGVDGLRLDTDDLAQQAEEVEKRVGLAAGDVVRLAAAPTGRRRGRGQVGGDHVGDEREVP